MHLGEVVFTALKMIKKKYQPTVKRVENALISVVFCQDLIS